MATWSRRKCTINNLKHNTTYKIFCTKNGDEGIESGLWDGSNYTSAGFSTNSSAKLYIDVLTDENGTLTFFFYCNYSATNHGSKTVEFDEIMICEGTEEKPYEPFGVMPSLAYPAKIEAVGDNINLYDKNNIEQGAFQTNVNTSYNELKVSMLTRIRFKNLLEIQKGESYAISFNRDVYEMTYSEFDSQEKCINMHSWTSNSAVFNATGSYVAVAIRKKDGSNITIDEIDNICLKIEKGSKTTTYSKYGQGSVEITTSNKNVLDIPTNAHVQMNGATVDTDNNGTITINGTFNANTYLRLYDNKKSLSAPGVWNKKRLIKGNWVFSSKIISNSINETAAVSAYIRNETVGANIVDYAMLYRVLGAKEKQQKFTLEENTDTVIYLWIAKDTTFDNVKLQFQLEPDELTDYIEHQGETLIMPIQQAMFDGDGFEKIDGVWYEKHNKVKRIFNGTENWSFNYNSAIFMLDVDNILTLSSAETSKLSNFIQSNTYSNKVYDAMYNKQTDGIEALNNRINIRESSCSTVAEFKTLLAQRYAENKAIYAVCRLKEPLLLKCTDEQSAILDKIDTYRDTTIIMTDDNLCKISLRYKQDLEAAIKEYTSRGHIYGIRRKITNNSSSEWERIEDAVGLIANAQKGSTAVQNDFDSLYPWSDIISYNYDTASKRITAYYGEPTFKFDGSNGEVLTRIPEFWYKRTRDDTYEYVYIADGKKEGYIKSEQFSVGRYTYSGSASGVHSRSGRAPFANYNITNARTYAKALGDGFGQLDWHYFLIQILYLVEYADYDSQAKLGKGRSLGSNTVANNSGGCDSLGMKSGTLSDDDTHSIIYRGIEDIYGNVWQFVDGINIKDYKAYVSQNSMDYAVDKFDGSYKALGYTNLSTTNKYQSAVGYDANNPIIDFPTEGNGASNTYMTDYYLCTEGNRIALLRW